MTLNRSGTSYRLEWNSRSASAERMSHLIVICRLAKEECFNRNIPILNILFYIGGGFMLRKQAVTLVRIFYQINEHKANDMIADLLSYGLLVKKQATDTKTCLYIMTKFPLAMYHECSTRDSCSVVTRHFVVDGKSILFSTV